MHAARVYWGTICDAQHVLGYDLLPPLVNQELARERMHVINAKMGRIVAKVDTDNESAATVEKLSHDERFFRVREWFMGVFPKDELTPDVLPYIQEFLSQAKKCPPQCFAFATDEVMSVLNELEDVDELSDVARFGAR